jgi:type IV pilus assembly protein PilY1
LPGNLKKYRLQNGELIGQDGALAIDPTTGFFNKTPPSMSYWSEAPDGDDATLGGAANAMPAWDTRDVYSNLTGTSNVALTNGSNSVTVGSTITAAQLGFVGPLSLEANIRAKVIEWTRGKDNLDANEDLSIEDDRHEMGAPLHVRPVSVIYGGTAADPDSVVHTMTSDGYLHAVNTRTGQEEWSFIPNRLLSRLYGLYENDESNTTSYGLDGEVIAYVIGDDFVPGIDPASEKVILLFGQRRGGDALFALDVSVRGKPTLAWVIDPTSDPALGDLGQTWSAPAIKKVAIGGTTKYVAIMGGGYDDTQDATGYFEDQTGNAVYMIDIETGDVVWSAGDNANHDLIMNTSLNADANATMKHSIPSRVQAVDLTGDGYVNRIYAGDMGGRMWRFDIVSSAASANELAEGGLLASIGAADLGAPAATDVRRLYARADIVPVIATEPGYRSYISLNIGSGHRAHPLETANEDWFFSIRDFNVFNTVLTEDYDEPVMFDDLIDITDDLTPTLMSSDVGWRLKLEAGPGEKSFTESLTFKGTTLFTTFSPTPASNSCESANAAGGLNRIYRISVLDGGAQVDKPPEEQDKTDRYEELEQGGIAPGVVMFFTNHDNDGDELPGEEGIEDGQAEEDCFSGTEQVACAGSDQYEVTYWFQNETQ